MWAPGIACQLRIPPRMVAGVMACHPKLLGARQSGKGEGWWRKTSCHRNCGDVDELEDFDAKDVCSAGWESKRRLGEHDRAHRESSVRKAPRSVRSGGKVVASRSSRMASLQRQDSFWRA
jgi:hypothetical protein